MSWVRSPLVTLTAFLCTSALLLIVTPSAHAQDGDAQATTPPPAHIALVDGAATVERDGQSQPAAANAPFVPGDRLRTTTGRVEVLFPDGTALDVDQYSAIDLQSPTLIRLVSGRIILVVAGAGDPAAATRFQIDTPTASAQTDGAGEYRVAVLNGSRGGVETELAVLRGSGVLSTESGSMPVRAGERTVARDNEAPAFPQAFNSARFDAFDRWAAAQRDARTGAASSSQYLPQDLQMYGGTLNRYGSWEYDAPHGYVWYPSVMPDWRPYYYGSWAPYEPWGWTWIGVDVWSWPTHHYGRWGFGRNRWFWIPGRRWGPAWVSWASAPGYVSWCPLGFNGRAVFGFGDSWHGWTVVPHNSFGYRSRVDRFAVHPQRIPVGVEAFVPHQRAPVDVPQSARRFVPTTTGVAVPRDRLVGSRESGVGSHGSGVGSRGSGVGGREPVVGSHGSVVGSHGSVVGSRGSTDGRGSAVGRPGSPVGRPGSAVDGRQPVGGSRVPGSGVDRGPTGVPRFAPGAQPEFKQPLPGTSHTRSPAVPRADPSSVPRRGVERPDTWGTPRVPRADPSFEPRRGMERSDTWGAPRRNVTPMPAPSTPYASPRSIPHSPQASPRWSPPAGAPPQRAYPTTRSPPSHVERRSAPPPSSPSAPAARGPATAAPRSGPPPGSASGSGGAAPRSGGSTPHSGGSTSHSGGSRGGGRGR